MGAGWDMKPRPRARIVISTWLVGPIAVIRGCGREVWSIAGITTDKKNVWKQTAHAILSWD
jgi:hypothetical protein